MKLPGLKTAKQAAGWLCGRIRGGAVILGYHRVDRAWMDPYSMCVSPNHFSEQLAVLQAYSHPTSLLDMAKQVQTRQLARRTVVITFDDGYADFCHAQALLERYRMPATVFVSPTYLGREFWWDELARILLSPATLPEKLALYVGDSLYEWAIDTPVKIVWNRMPPSPRQRLLHELYRQILPLSCKERQGAIEQLRAWAGQGMETKPQCRALDAGELLRLATARQVDIGLHSMTHPVLARLPETAQQAEIEQGKAYLQELLGQPVTAFSYPNGSFTKETIALVECAGFVCACASQGGRAWHKSQLFRLPRLWVPDCDGRAFARWLHKWI